MPWNPNVPNVINRVQDDLAAIRENFQHLDQLAELVDELQTVSELAPIANDLQTVSGLAPVIEELQAVSELAPYVQALLGSRIVDHNLDVADPPNGWYVRYRNGLQVAFHNVSFGDIPGGETREISWVPPAQFSAIFGGITSHIRRTFVSPVHLAAFRSGCRIDTGDSMTVIIAVTNATGITRAAVIFVFLIGLAVSS